jgi:hypothetical protein
MQLQIFNKPAFRKMRVLIGCECEGGIRDAFLNAGHDAISCDLKPSTNGGPHFQGDIFYIIRESFDLGIFHPPCTFLTVTANKWLKDQPPRKSGALVGEARRQAQRDGIEFVKRLWAAAGHIESVCFENPVGVLSSQWQKPSQIIQPFQFGHVEPKKTCLWLKNLPLLIPTKNVQPEYHTTKSGNRLPKWYAYADKSQGQEARAAIRSKTFSGIADAMANQWGKQIFI